MSGKPKLRLSSLNVRLISNKKKRQTIFQWLKTSYQGIVLLQKTLSLEKDKKQWVSEWGGEIIFAYGTNNSRGVAMLLDSTCEYIVSDIVRYPNGRFIVLKITLHNESFVSMHQQKMMVNHRDLSLSK